MTDEEIVSHVGLVHKVARSIERHNRSVEYEDLVGYGMIGLVHAARRFDPEAGFTFSSFAVPRIRGAMIDEIRRRNGRYAGSPKRTAVVVSLEYETAATVCSDDEPLDETILDRIVAEQALATLPPRQGRVMELLYLDGLSQCEIASAVGRSESVISRARVNALTALRGRLCA